MGCGTSRTWAAVGAAQNLEESPTIWVGNIPSGFGHINSYGLCVVNELQEDDLSQGESCRAAELLDRPSLQRTHWSDWPPATRARGTAAFSEYGEVVGVSLRKKGGEFDAKNWALVTFADAASAGRALFSKVRYPVLTAGPAPAHSECYGVLQQTVVVDEAFDEVTLKVKSAAIDENLGGRGALGDIAKKQNAQVQKVEARRRSQEVDEDRSEARKARRERRKQLVDPEADEKLAALKQKFGNSEEDGPTEHRRRTSETHEKKRKKKPSAVVGDPHERSSAAHRRRSSARDSDSGEVDIDRTTMWCTAWVGGIPSEYVQSNAELKVLRLFKKFGKVVRVTVRKKPDQKKSYKSWAFITFQEAGAVAAAMRSEVRMPEYKCVLKVKPAAVSTQLEKNDEGALGRMWQEQQSKVRLA